MDVVIGMETHDDDDGGADDTTNYSKSVLIENVNEETGCASLPHSQYIFGVVWF